MIIQKIETYKEFLLVIDSIKKIKKTKKMKKQKKMKTI